MFAGIFSCTPSFSPEINNVYLILSYLILSYLILSYLILSYLILSYLILSYLILSYLILSYLILSYLILSYLILSYLYVLVQISKISIIVNEPADPILFLPVATESKRD